MSNVNCNSVKVEELDLKNVYLKTDGLEKFKPTPPLNKQILVDIAERYPNAIFINGKEQESQVSPDNNYESKDEMVSHPPHYQSETGLEVIDVIEAFTCDLKGIEATDTGNVIKYICRWKQKNGLQDLEKAKWYLQHLINHVEKLEKENECYE